MQMWAMDVNPPVARFALTLWRGPGGECSIAAKGLSAVADVRTVVSR